MNACEYLQQIRYTPVGEYLRLVVLRRLSKGPAPVEEVDELAKRAVEKLGIRYDWRVWPKLVEGEVEFRGGVVAITPRGRRILELTGEEIAEYVKKRLGVEV
jgi:vacuolar-type H+-ATPase subunit E/Vma4